MQSKSRGWQMTRDACTEQKGRWKATNVCKEKHRKLTESILKEG